MGRFDEGKAPPSEAIDFELQKMMHEALGLVLGALSGLPTNTSRMQVLGSARILLKLPQE